MAEEIQDVIEALDELLEQERKALLKGDFDGLAALHDEKTALIDSFNELDQADAERVQDLQVKLGRNQELLNAALDGIRGVAKRLAEVRRVRTSLDTYTQNGAKTSIETNAEKAVEKRA